MAVDLCLVLLPCWGITDIPLTLSALSSRLRGHGVPLKVFDFNVELYHLLSQERPWWDISRGLDLWEQESFIDRFWKENLPVIETLIDDALEPEPRWVGFSLFVSNRLLTERFARRLKEKAPSAKIVFGGPEVGAIEDLQGYADRHPFIDHLVVGEGEETLPALLRGQETRRIVANMDGVRDLDSLPLQDFSDYDFALYKDVYAFPTYSSRGCPNACIYCTERNFAGRFRIRSAERLFEDVQRQKTLRPDLNMFRLHESTSNGSVPQLERFCDLMAGASLGLRWAINGAIMRREMNDRICAKLARAGCRFINYGLETPSHKVLAAVGKRLSAGTNFDRVVRSTHDAGIEVALNVMFGLPGETEADFQEQLDFLRRNHRHISTIAPSLWFCYFPKGSEGARHPGKHGIDLEMGPLYWRSPHGTNDYLVRMERFVRYTDLMQELGVKSLFGFPALPNRRELAAAYCHELVRRGHLSAEEARGRLGEMRLLDMKPARGENMLRSLLRKIIYAVAPAAVHNAVSEIARARLLERRLNKLLKERGARQRYSDG
ncbi:MAG: radical SAM protein [Elusimicrobia bacterium]|nr:radical SAM protein [Elusimicrobiota bacterium]